MLSFKRLFLLIQLHGLSKWNSNDFVNEFVVLVCRESEDYRRISSSINPFVLLISASIDDQFVVINCSTPDRVPHHKLDWYFQTRTSLKPPRVIWQRGRSNIARYIAYSPDQFRHFLQIQPIHSNDTGTYMCLDQTTGFFDRIELVVGK